MANQKYTRVKQNQKPTVQTKLFSQKKINSLKYSIKLKIIFTEFKLLIKVPLYFAIIKIETDRQLFRF